MVVVGESANNLIDMILLYDFQNSLLESINVRDRSLSYDSIYRGFNHHISSDND